jgi:hypothetical protein
MRKKEEKIDENVLILRRILQIVRKKAAQEKLKKLQAAAAAEEAALKKDEKMDENKIYQGITDVLEKNLEQMKENFSAALAQKAAEALEEKKVAIASSYFGTK